MRDLLNRLIELRRLMRLTGMTVPDALGLLLDQLRYFEEVQEIEDGLKHAEYPRHVYGH